jgi:hypothetical protein
MGVCSSAACSPRSCASSSERTVRWVYDAVEARLFRDSQVGRGEVPLSRQQHRLVAFMVKRNRRAGGKPALCEREELIGAVWGR